MDVAEILAGMARQLAELSAEVKAGRAEVRAVRALVEAQKIEKEWYSTAELAQAMHVSGYTVQERWCNRGRIECEKNPHNGKWRIPGHEFRRLVGGGELRQPTPAA